MKKIKQANEWGLYGRAAVAAAFKKRPNDVIKVFLEEKHKKQFKHLLDHCRRQKLAYKFVSEGELSNITKSNHHEGIYLITKAKPIYNDQALIKTSSKKDESAFVFLDNVANPHNIGAIIRSAAHFGIRNIVVEKKHFNSIPPSLARVAEGGLEYVEIFSVNDLKKCALDLQKANYKIFATSSHSSKPLSEVDLPQKSVILLGNEVQGLSAPLIKCADTNIAIPGTGQVESLNVAQAASILFAKWYQCL